MAKITYIDPIKSVSGKLSKKHHAIYNVRKAPTNNRDMIANPNYTSWRDPNKRVILTASQMAWNQRFGEICTATRARLVDASKMNADRVAFAQQDEYKTLYAFVWNLVKAEIA